MRFPVVARVLAGTALFALLGACADVDPVTPRAPASPPADQRVETIARGVSKALTTPALRTQLRHDLGESGRLPLDGYLRGGGSALADAAAKAVGMERDAFLGLMRELPALELALPMPADLARWDGGDELVVAGTLASGAELARLSDVAGFNTRTGAAVRVAVGTYLPFPLLVIAPAAAAAPDRPGAVVSGGDCGVYARECTTEGTTDGSQMGGAAIPSGMTSACFSTTFTAMDADHDYMRDDCEYEIAHLFRPYLQFDRYDHETGRESYWAVEPSSTTRQVKILYMLAYYRDGGTMVAYDDVGDHLGDSEFLYATVEYANGKWRLVKMYLSAHWNKLGWDSSSERDASVFSYPSGYRVRPKVWVAKEKHANYHSASKCDEGANYFDSCDHPVGYLEEVEVLPQRNIGSNGLTFWANRRLDCVPSTALYTNRGGTECFWSGNEFRGWSTFSGTGSPPYRHVLDAYSF
jgi:hypothetical protein